MKNSDNKHIFLLLVCLHYFAPIDGQCQSLKGKYQRFTEQVSAAYHDLYEFEGNSFKFIPTGYDGLGGVREIRGQYEVTTTDSIKFYLKEIEIYKISGVEKIPWSPNNNKWTIVLNEKDISTLIKRESTEFDSFKITKKENGIILAFRIGNDEFFKIEE